MSSGAIHCPPPPTASPPHPRTKGDAASAPLLSHPSLQLPSSLKMRLISRPGLTYKGGLFTSTLRSYLHKRSASSQVLVSSSSPGESLSSRVLPEQFADGGSLSVVEPLIPQISEDTFVDFETSTASISNMVANRLVFDNSLIHEQREASTTVASCSASAMNSSNAVSMASQQHEVVIALGSNMGNRVENFDKALDMLRRDGVDVICHSNLYESAPAYVTDQPKFLNSAVRASTKLNPSSLLGVLKGIERSLGRTFNGIRYGPRPIDLDILFFGDVTYSDENLTLPHPLIWERPFVLAPLMDLYSTKLRNGNDVWEKRYERAKCAWQLIGGDNQLCQGGLRRVVPVGGKLCQFSDRTHMMGIINVTPDSFSDGGKHLTVQDAVSQAECLVQAGADIIDLGAQSTRPFATRLAADEELARLIPVLEAITKLSCMESVWLSVDTFHSKVAREAVRHGAHIVNDVSGGCLDPDMHKTVAELGVPYVVVHMRGDPQTMLQGKNVQYMDVTADVSAELCENLRKAESSGIPAWRLIVDPGLGFSKTSEQNVRLLRELSSFRSGLGSWSFTAKSLPLLIGPSRKRFLGKICNQDRAEDRDIATIGALVAGIAQGVDIVRLHNVKATVDAIRVADAIFKTKDLKDECAPS